MLGFSDLQADIAAQLVRLGLNVYVFNHRDVAGILQMIRVLGGMIGCEAKADALADAAGAGSRRGARRGGAASRDARACTSRSGMSR